MREVIIQKLVSCHLLVTSQSIYNSDSHYLLSFAEKIHVLSH